MRSQRHHSLIPFLALVVGLCAMHGAGFSPPRSSQRRAFFRAENDEVTQTGTPAASSYEDTDAASQGLVSSLTNLVNSLSGPRRTNNGPESTTTTTPSAPRNPPTSIEELTARIRDDYVENNYLWTGKLDLECFDPSCKFTDPTLSFEGTDTFQRNTQNLVPLVDRFVQNYQSILLDIRTTPEYVETRWNMVGELNTLFWKPKIDVIGQTKFWFRKQMVDGEQKSSLQVYEYDEKWEIPAYQALLQLVTAAGTFPNSTTDKSR